MKQFICQIFMLQVIQAYITFQQGGNSDLVDCTGISFKTTTITFSDSFQNIPQLHVEPNVISIGHTGQNEVILEILSLTQINFQIKASCTILNIGFIKYQFKWLALDESRIQILRPLRQTTLTTGTIYTHSHSLTNAQQGIVILDSFGFNGELDFNFKIIEVASSFVKLQITNNNSNLQSIGYSIVLGTKEAFVLTSIYVTGGGNDVLGSYTIPELQNGILFKPFSGFSWDASNTLRIQNTGQLSSGNFYISYKTFSGSVIRSVTFQGIQFFSKILFPFFIQTYRITKQWAEPSSSLMQVTFIELSKIYNTEIQESFTVLSTQQLLNVKIEIILQKGYKIEGFFLKCNECGDNNKYTTKQTYYSQTNYIKFTLKLQQYTDADASIQISITSSKILIQQYVHQVVEYYDIIQLEILPDV